MLNFLYRFSETNHLLFLTTYPNKRVSKGLEGFFSGMLASHNIPIGKVIKLLSGSVAGAAIFVLIGWAFDISVFKSVFDGYQTMKVNAAICFLLVGIGLYAYKPEGRFQLIPSLSAALVLVISVTTLIQEFFNVELGIDTFFVFGRDVYGSVISGRMAPTTAFSFFLMALALFTKERRCGEKLIPFVFVPILQLISSIAVIGYFFNVPALFKWSFVSSMALHTAALIFLVSLVLSLHYPKKGFFGLLNGLGYGNLVARRIFPAIVVSILFLSFIRISASRLNLVTEEFGIVVFAYSFIIVSTAIVAIVAIQLNRIDKGRTEAESALSKLHQELKNEFDIATKQLLESQKKFQSIFELSPAGIAIADMGTSFKT